jgi:hypothetical protein
MDKNKVTLAAECGSVAVGQLAIVPVEWRGALMISEVLRRVKRNLHRLFHRQVARRFQLDVYGVNITFL